MTKRHKNILYIIIFLSFILKEEIFNFLFSESYYLAQAETMTDTRNKTLEAKESELTESYGYIDSIPYHLEPSKILINNLYHLNNEILVYKGEEEGIKENNLVINELGLVGIVSKTNKHSSYIKLLTNESLNISVKINESYGILKNKNNALIIEGIKNQDWVEVGDIVTTSDLSIYPENILIGKVAAINTDRYEIEKILTVEPATHFNELKYLSIITDLRGEK